MNNPYKKIAPIVSAAQIFLLLLSPPTLAGRYTDMPIVIKKSFFYPLLLAEDRANLSGVCTLERSEASSDETYKIINEIKALLGPKYKPRLLTWKQLSSLRALERDYSSNMPLTIPLLEENRELGHKRTQYRLTGLAICGLVISLCTSALFIIYAIPYNAAPTQKNYVYGGLAGLSSVLAFLFGGLLYKCQTKNPFPAIDRLDQQVSESGAFLDEISQRLDLRLVNLKPEDILLLRDDIRQLSAFKHFKKIFTLLGLNKRSQFEYPTDGEEQLFLTISTK